MTASGLALVGALTGLGVLTAPSATAVTARAQVQYSCNNMPADHPEMSRVDPVNAALELDLPGSVNPGQSLNLRGVFSLQLPASIQDIARQYFKTMNAESDSLTFPMAVNGQTQPLRGSGFQTATVSPTTDPQVLSAVVSLQAATVPAGATGDITVDLPHNGSAQSPIDQAPVAFVASVSLQGDNALAPAITMVLACSAPEGARLSIASIPITEQTTTPPPDSENPTPSENPRPGGNAPPVGGATDPTAVTSSAAGAVPFSDPTFEETVGLPQETVAAATGDAAGVDVPTSTAANPDGIYVPSWIFSVASLIAVLISLSSMVWMRRRVRLLRTNAGL